MNDGRDPWITVRDVAFRHGRREVFSGISLDLRPGRHYIIAGQNGAGKSTLLDLLSRLRTPAAGSIRVMGEPAESYAAMKFAALLALAPQECQLNFAFTVEEVVAMGRRPFLGRWGRLGDEDWRRVGDAVSALDLEPLRRRQVTALSGGERRRCVVARAVAQSTPILLLDEPSAGLDISRSLSLMSLARNLAEQGNLVVTVSHDLNLAAAFGHEIILLKDGTIRAAGPVEEKFTADILSDVYETDAMVRRDEFTGGLSVSFRMREKRMRGAP